MFILKEYFNVYYKSSGGFSDKGRRLGKDKDDGVIDV